MSKSGAQIFADAQKATAAAASVHIAGTVTSGSDTVTLDIVATPARSGGSITEDGATIDVVSAESDVYLKGSAAAMAKLSGDAAAGQLIGGRGLQTTSANKDFGGLDQLFNLNDLVHQLKPSGAVRKGPTTTVAGRPAITLIDTGDNGTLLVATTGPPYMLELRGSSGERGSISFDQYGSAHPPAVPSGAINLDQLEKGS